MTNEYKDNSDVVDQLYKDIENGVQDMVSSDKFAEYLNYFADFHRYSYGNTMLIKMQKPTATVCASYPDWQKKGRYTESGKGIKILYPYKVKYVEVDGERVYAKQYTPQIKMSIKDGAMKEKTFTKFGLGNVWDVSDTQGKEIPSITQSITGTSNVAIDTIDLVTDILNIPVVYEQMPEKTGGYYRWSPDECIALNTLKEPNHQMKTLIHEMAHYMLHGTDKPLHKAEGNVKEVQAESVAYIVTRKLGLDTSEYSFGYVGGWSSGDKTLLKDSMRVIKDTSKDIINQIEQALEKEHEVKNEMLQSFIDSVESGKVKDTETDFNNFINQNLDDGKITTRVANKTAYIDVTNFKTEKVYLKELDDINKKLEEKKQKKTNSYSKKKPSKTKVKGK